MPLLITRDTVLRKNASEIIANGESLRRGSFGLSEHAVLASKIFKRSLNDRKHRTPAAGQAGRVLRHSVLYKYDDTRVAASQGLDRHRGFMYASHNDHAEDFSGFPGNQRGIWTGEVWGRLAHLDSRSRGHRNYDLIGCREGIRVVDRRQ